MPHYVASGLGLHSLPMSHKMDARLIWVVMFFLSSADEFRHLLIIFANSLDPEQGLPECQA